MITRKLIEEIWKVAYISVVNGFWYEYRLAMPYVNGFNFFERTVRLYGEGETKILTTTWQQVCSNWELIEYASDQI